MVAGLLRGRLGWSKLHAVPGVNFDSKKKNIYIQVKLKIFTSLRCYWTTNSLFTWGDAQNFCETLGLGLVKWDTADIYLDLKYLSNQFEFWTALTNTNEEECDTRSLGPSACNGLLVRAKYQKNPMVYQNNLSLIAMAANIWWAK